MVPHVPPPSAVRDEEQNIMTIREPAGIYPMQYAFFDRRGELDRSAMRRQAEAALRGGAHGVAVLGLATEVGKLSGEERRRLIDWVTRDIAGRVPVAATIAGATVRDQVELARHAQAAGAAWLILQPPPERGRPESEYEAFFAQVMASVDLPVAIQNAPEYTGIGLGDEALARLARAHPNFVLLKGEGPALTIRRTIEAVGGHLRVFNGRGGLELPDNLRAGCAGMIPATDNFDYQVRVFELMREGDASAVERAEAMYREVLPAIVFVMQSLDSLICYGKRLAAMRMGMGEVHDRQPAMTPHPFGLECVRRYAAQLGPLD